jgi:mycarose O-acyltransferase
MLPLVNIPAFQFWWIYQFPPVRLLDFVFGILLARIVLTGQRLPIRFGGAVVLTVIGYTIATYLPASYSMVAVCFIPVGLLVAGASVADRDGRRTGLSGRGMVALGEISFAFYLWHRLVLESGHVLLGATRQWSTPEAVGMLVAALAIVLALSWLTYSFVERSLMRRFAYPRVRQAKERAALPQQERLPEASQREHSL